MSKASKLGKDFGISSFQWGRAAGGRRSKSPTDGSQSVSTRTQGCNDWSGADASAPPTLVPCFIVELLLGSHEAACGWHGKTTLEHTVVWMETE